MGFDQTAVFPVHPLLLVAAFLLDFMIGDPSWLPHPVRIMGGAVGRIEAVLWPWAKTARREKLAGMVLVLFMVALVFLISALVMVLFNLSSQAAASLEQGAIPLGLLPRLAAWVVLVYLTASCIAVRELTRSAQVVILALKADNPAEARAKLGLIVGRDTAGLTNEGILKATIETLAENLSDGVIAPLFYLLIGGLPLALVYKAVNTLDSMVGYKNERYRYFGWAAARLDDAANYVPARISGFLIVAATAVYSLFKKGGRFGDGPRQAWKMMLRDSGKHASPNSGVPEAAMAGALGIRLGGPASYQGVMVDKPYLGEDRGTDYPAAAEGALAIVWLSSFLGFLLSLAIAALIHGWW